MNFEILACIHCNFLAWCLLPIALWVIRKLSKKHSCPCNCHKTENKDESTRKDL
jgi:hypothetical protein